jgi:hypothetical protein
MSGSAKHREYRKPVNQLPLTKQEAKLMNESSAKNYGLPIHGNLSLLIASSALVAILMLAAALAGIFFTAESYPSEEFVHSFVPTDVSVLLIGLPMLLAALWLARRGSLIGLLLWPGALLFVVYNYLVYLLALPLNLLFLLILVLVALSAYTLASLLLKIEFEVLRTWLEGRVPARLSGAILAVLGSLFVARALSILIGAINGAGSLLGTEVALNVTDFLLSPTWIIGGIALWRRQAFGYAAGLGLLYQASMLFIGLIIFMLVQPFITEAAFNPVDVVVVFVMGLICFIPFGLFLRRASAAGRPDATKPEGNEHEK